MKKLLCLSLLFLSGCEVYQLESPPKLTGGKWVLTDYEISVNSSISDAKVIKNDTVCISLFNLQQINGNNLVLKQDFNRTAIDRRFVRGKTTWEFDSNNTELYCNYIQMLGKVKPDPFWVSLSLINNNLKVMNTSNGSVTNFTYRTNDVGYPRTLTLLSPPIITDLYMSNGTRDKAVTVVITLYFMR